MLIQNSDVYLPSLLRKVKKRGKNSNYLFVLHLNFKHTFMFNPINTYIHKYTNCYLTGCKKKCIQFRFKIFKIKLSYKVYQISMKEEYPTLESKDTEFCFL